MFLTCQLKNPVQPTDLYFTSIAGIFLLSGTIFIYLFFDSEGRLVEQAGWVNWFKVKTEKIIDHFPEGNVAILWIIDYWESHFTVLKTGALVQQTSSGLKREKTEGRGVNAF